MLNQATYGSEKRDELQSCELANVVASKLVM